MWAALAGHEGVVRLLLARGARLDMRSNESNTALLFAVENKRVGVVALLCAAPGAAAALALKLDGRTPLGHAIALGHAACEAILRAHGATT